MNDFPFDPNDLRRALREGIRAARGHGRRHEHHHHERGEHGPRDFGPRGFGRGFGHSEPAGDFGQHPGPNFPPEGLPGFPGRPGFGGPGFPGFPPFGPGFGRPGGRGRRGGHGHGHGRGRARRGNVRNAVLILLNERPMHGYEIIKEIASRSGGWWRPSPGSVYPTLQLLADEGLIKTEATDGTGKRLYSITDEGKAEAAKLDKTAPWEQAADDVDAGDVALREALMSLMDAARQVSNVAGPELKARATKLITDTRRELYLILADADSYGSGDAEAAQEATDDPDES